MEQWEEIISKLPTCFQDLFFKDFDDTFKTCTQCGDTYPEHKIFYRPTKYKGEYRFYTCRNCMENKLIDKYYSEGIPLQSLTVYFKQLLQGHKYCKHCDKILEHTIENFTHTSTAECRHCLGVKRLKTNYKENAELKNKSLKKCKYCNLIKDIENFDIHSQSKGNTVSYCKECRGEYKSEKRKYDQVYLHENKDNKKEYYSKWKQNGGQLIRRVNEQKREAKKMNLLSDFNNNQWMKTLEFFDFSCAYCGLCQGEHLNIHNMMLHQDHIIPVTEQGVYSDFNIVPACLVCNSTKNNHDLEAFVEFNNIPKERYIKVIDYILTCV